MEVCQKYISQTHEQLKVHIEGLQSNILFIIVEIIYDFNLVNKQIRSVSSI
jgi:hypothetical protein